MTRLTMASALVSQTKKKKNENIKSEKTAPVHEDKRILLGYEVEKKKKKWRVTENSTEDG